MSAPVLRSGRQKWAFALLLRVARLDALAGSAARRHRHVWHVLSRSSAAANAWDGRTDAWAGPTPVLPLFGHQSLTLLKSHLFKYQGHVSAALVLGGVDVTVRSPLLATLFSSRGLPWTHFAHTPLASSGRAPAHGVPARLDGHAALRYHGLRLDGGHVRFRGGLQGGPSCQLCCSSCRGESTEALRLLLHLNPAARWPLDAPQDMTREEAMALVARSIKAGIFNDLGSGSNVDLCVITKARAPASSRPRSAVTHPRHIDVGRRWRK